MSPASAKQPELEIAYAAHHAFVRERLRGLGVAAADLDDATQDVFEVLVRRIADYDPARPIRAWMAGMARKVARRYRERGRRGIVALDERRASMDDSPEDRAAQAEAREVLRRFVDELEPERWSVFVLSEIEGLRGSEIAAELGLNLNTVYARLRSARQAFERTLRRHRAREQRKLRALVIGPWRWAVVGGLALSGGVWVMTCDEEQRARPHAESDPSPLTPPTAAQPNASSAERMLASDRVSTSSTEVWIEGGSSVSMGHNSKGEGYTFSSELRYRLEGDRVVLEVTYIGDDDVAVDAVGHQLASDDFELVDGATDWALEVPASETRVVSTMLRATREGVVRLRVTSSNGSRRFAWVVEHGQLRPCHERECEAPIGEEQLSGERIIVHVHNQCSVGKEFVLFAGYPDVRPPDTVTVHSLEPDERRSMEIDAAQWILHRHADGHIGGGGQTDTDDARVTFYEIDGTCSGMSTTTN